MIDNAFDGEMKFFVLDITRIQDLQMNIKIFVFFYFPKHIKKNIYICVYIYRKRENYHFIYIVKKCTHRLIEFVL